MVLERIDPLNLHETAGLFAFKAKYTTKIYCKTTKYIFPK